MTPEELQDRTDRRNLLSNLLLGIQIRDALDRDKKGDCQLVCEAETIANEVERIIPLFHPEQE